MIGTPSAASKVSKMMGFKDKTDPRIPVVDGLTLTQPLGVGMPAMTNSSHWKAFGRPTADSRS